MGELLDYLAQHDPNFRKGRLPALYSDFRSQRTLNPDGYEANISAWRQALSRLAADGLLTRHTSSDASSLVVQVDNTLLRQLESTQFGQPLALGTVIRDAVAARDLMPLNDFLKAPQSIYQRGWGDVPWSVMSWTLRQLGIADLARGEDTLPTGQYVVLQNLEDAGRQLSEPMASKTSIFDRVFTKTQFRAEFVASLTQGKKLSDKDLDILLRFLSRDKGMIQYDGQTIRIRGTGEDGPITKQDASIASMKELTASLRHQVDLLNNRIDELDAAAKSAVARKNRVAALAALKSRKMTEASLSTRYATLNQLEEVASRIEQAVDQVALVKVMESSTGVLKGLNTQIGGAERVDDVMDRLREEMGATDEVAAILSESAGAPVDEGELDDELEGMLAQEKRKEDEAKEAANTAEARSKLEQLPQVPTEDEFRKTKEQSPTSATGIADLSISDNEREARPMASN